MARSKNGKTTDKSATDISVSEESVEKAETAVKKAEDAIEEAKETVTDAFEKAEESLAEAEHDVAALAEGTAQEIVSDDAEVPADFDTASDDITDGHADQEEPDSISEVDETLADVSDDSVVADEDSPSEIPEKVTEPTIIQEKVIERKGGFFPMVLGGVVAAGLGFVGASFTGIQLFQQEAEPDPFRAEVEQGLAAQAEQIAALGTSVSDTRQAIEVIDLNPVMTALAGVEDRVSETGDMIAGLEEQLAGFDSRLTALEKQPVAAAVGPEAIAAYERELEELRAAIQDQKDAVAAQKAAIEAMAAEALAAEAGAEAQATLAANRAALAELTTAAQAGQPFSEPLAILTGNGVAVPEALSATAADGVATLASLAADFPEAARAALRVARSSAVEDDNGGGFASFLQSQLGARSVTPREGNDPDAVLSRAEAAVRDGDLEAALTEISALPENAQSILASWTGKAETRRDALAAASALAQQLNQ